MADNTQWFKRCVGSWTSYRRYMYGNSTEPDNITTYFSMAETGDNAFCLTWGSDRNKGEMNFEIDGDVVHRDIGYYSSAPTDSKMERIDDDTIVFRTGYGGIEYREEIRLLLNDTVRLRQTLGTKNGKVNVVGQYYEVREDVSD